MVSRDELYTLVWAKPMREVAKEFGVSDSYLIRVCAALNIPRPGRGYWAKHAVGDAPPQLPLPTSPPGDQLSWEPGDELSFTAQHRPPAQGRGSVRTQFAGEHGLIREARRHIDHGRSVDEGAYLKPYKKLMVDITSSKACFEKAFSFASKLFNAFEAAGHRVMLAPARGMHRIDINEHEEKGRKPQSFHESRLWRPQGPTVVYVGSVPIGLVIVEMSESILMRYVNGKYIRDADYVPPKRSRYYEDRTWTTTESKPSGRLRLIAYSPSWRVTWSAEWQETQKSTLDSQIPSICKAIVGSVPLLKEKQAQAEREEEARRIEHAAAMERHAREEDERKIAQSIKDSREHLQQVIESWSRTKSIQQFLQGVENSAADLPDDQKKAVLARLKAAREFLGETDPMRFMMDWKLPAERYQPRYRTQAPDSEE